MNNLDHIMNIAEQYLLYLMMPTNDPVMKPKKAKASGTNYYIQSYML